MATIHSLVLSTLQHCQGNILLVADENCLDFPFSNLNPSVQVISNRHDVATQATAAGLNAIFSDFDFAAGINSPVDNIVYRISKEKPVVHHIANQSLRALKKGGKLWLLGGKKEGIKTFAGTIGRQFADQPEVSKQGQMYRVKIVKNADDCTLLDDRHYRQLREICSIDEKPVVSKPGLFGWDKVDRGSELLGDYLPEFFRQLNHNKRLSVLDLGCGYGYLCLRARQLGDFSFTATDNCAAALTACTENFKHHHIDGQVIHDDCGETIDRKFAAILCNPPFHQGFSQERNLTEKFLRNTRRLLAANGKALFVVNQFVPLESLAQHFFKNVTTIKKTDGFTLVELDNN